MPVIATTAADWNDDETKRLAASIQKVVELRFGSSDTHREVGYITDPVRLREILEIAMTTPLDEIEAAIRSAAPPQGRATP